MFLLDRKQQEECLFWKIQPRYTYIVGGLFFSCLFFISFSFSQDLKNYVKFAQQKFDEGDYIYAIEYYERAMQLDSNTIDILWGYAETLRAYKDYRKAAFYYGKVYSREETALYPSSLLNYGLMLKQNARYDEALEVFKKAKKKYRKRGTRDYLYQKSRVEVESCAWAKANQGDSTRFIFEGLPHSINTPNAEFAHRTKGDKIYFSSLRADSVSQTEEVYAKHYSTHLYEAKIGEYKENRMEGVNWDDANTGNGTYSLDGRRFYFSHCKDKGHNYQCKILVAYVEKEKFVDVDTLGDIINYPNANTTMPFIGEWEGSEVLFYASDREGGKGGLDIWYSFINNGNQFRKPMNAKRINSPDNELSPFWDNASKTLYFSSSWYNGFGGYDVFKSQYNTEFEEPENLMEPINSPANDIYYFQTITGDTAFVSSNRWGSNYSKNPTCCSDIYFAYAPPAPEPPTIKESLIDLNKRLPVTLYFHNDIPNPRSWETVTKVNYIDSYYDYIKMIDQYKKEYSAGLKGDKAEDAREDIDDFFTEYVKQGVKDLQQFRDLLFEELERGRKIEMTIKGFASPLAKTEYNVNLTQRRIESLKNYLRAYNGGIFRDYIDLTASNGGRLTFKEVPFGEYEANQFISDNPNDVKNSVFSRAAASERKIEIQSVDIVRNEDKLTTLLSADVLVFNAGLQQSGSHIEHVFTLKNKGQTEIIIDKITTSDENVIFTYPKSTLQVGEEMNCKLSFDTSGLIGHKVAKATIEYNEVEKGLELSITTELE